MSGQYAVSAHSENQEMCTSIIGQGVQFFSDDVNQSCDKVNIYVQFGNIMTIAGIVMAVIGGSSTIVGADNTGSSSNKLQRKSKSKKGITPQQSIALIASIIIIIIAIGGLVNV